MFLRWSQLVWMCTEEELVEGCWGRKGGRQETCSKRRHEVGDAEDRKEDAAEVKKTFNSFGIKSTWTTLLNTVGFKQDQTVYCEVFCAHKNFSSYCTQKHEYIRRNKRYKKWKVDSSWNIYAAWMINAWKYDPWSEQMFSGWVSGCVRFANVIIIQKLRNVMYRGLPLKL